MMDWITNNYKWFFSGAGVFLFTVVSGFVIRHQIRKRTTIKNIINGNKAKVNIIQSEGNVKIINQNLNNMIGAQSIAELLEERRSKFLKLETKLTRKKKINDPEKEKAGKYNNRAVRLAREGKYNEALLNIRKAINIAPEEELYKENLVTITENYASALLYDSSLFNKAINLMEKLKEEGLLSDGNGYFILGHAYFKKKLYEQAISAYKQAIIFEPKNYFPYLLLAETYSDKGIKDNNLNCQEEALKEIALSLRLNPQEIKIDDLLHSSFAELILLKALVIINKSDAEQIKIEYKDFLIRVGCYSSNEIDRITEKGRLYFLIAAISMERYRKKIEEKIGSRVDPDTMMHGVKTIEEIQAMVKEATNKEISISILLKLLQRNKVSEKEKFKLVVDLIQRFGKDEAMVFLREFDKFLKKRKRWIISYKPKEN